MIELWPFTNFHDMNLDWIINRIKNVETSEANAKASEEAAADSASDAADSADTALLYRNAAKDFRDEAQGFANDAQGSADSIAGVVTQVNANSSRIDNLIANAGDGTIPSELVDIRIDANGFTYDVAGDTVRGTTFNIENMLNVTSTLEPVPLGSMSPGYLSGTGTITAATANKELTTDNFVEIEHDNIYVIQYYCEDSNTPWAAVGWYDDQQTWIRRIEPVTGSTQYIPVRISETDNGKICITCILSLYGADNAKYLKISYRSYDNASFRLYKAPLSTSAKFNFNFTPFITGGTTPLQVDTNAQTVTFPGDTLLQVAESYPYLASNGGSPKSSIQMSSANQPLTVSYNNVTRPNGSITTAVVILWNNRTKNLVACSYDDPLIIQPYTHILACLRKKSNGTILFTCPAAYTVDGNLYGIEPPQGAEVWRLTPNINSINHKGYNSIAPENTLPAFRLSKTYGFDMVECDLQRTSDGVPVVIHDDTINRTARNLDGTTITNPVYVYNETYQDLVDNYDYGIWKGAAYAGVKMPTWQELCHLAKSIGLTIYAEIKTQSNWTQAELKNLVDIAVDEGIMDKVVFISSGSGIMSYLRSILPNARMAYVTPQVDASAISYATTLNLFLDVNASNIDASMIQTCKTNNIPLELWTIDTSADIINVDPYVTGITSNDLVAAKVLYTANI